MENARHRQIVEAGGGHYVPGMLGDLVLFNSPRTGTTLAVEEKYLTVEVVKTKIFASDREFEKYR